MIVEAHRSAVDPVELQRFAAEAFSVARMQADLSDPTMFFLLAQMGDKVCGMVRLHPSTPPTCVQVARPVELARLYLEADAIGRGVGSKLMATALARAAADGYETCWLCVWTGNQRAINFYQRWGFETLDLVFLPVIDSQVPCLVMARSLAMTAPLVQ